MALPASSVLLALATCAAFTLAIRDTLNGRTPKQSAAAAAAELAEDSYRRAIAEAEAHRDEQARLWRQRAAALHAIYGSTPGTPGPAFAMTPLGMPAPPDDRADALRALADAPVDVRFAGEPLSAISVHPQGSLDDPERAEICEMLRLQLVDAWGSGHIATDGSRYWFDETTGMRAVHSSRYDCLRFDRAVLVSAWVSRDAHSIVPLGALGEPARLLSRELTSSTTVRDLDEAGLTWTDLGIAATIERTNLAAYVRAGRVVALDATIVVDRGTERAIEAHLVTLFGPPTGTGEILQWERPRLTLDRTDSLLRLTAGRIPPE